MTVVQVECDHDDPAHCPCGVPEALVPFLGPPASQNGGSAT